MIENFKNKKTLSEWTKFEHFFKSQQVAAKTTLLREGEISKKAFYIDKGCVRLWFNNNGKDITFQFFFEGSGGSSIESFRTNQPSLFSIETIEPCILRSIHKKDFIEIVDSSPVIKEQIEENIF